MLLGLDVGGTHTDAVLINKKGEIVSHKAVTRHDDLLSSINEAFEGVVKEIDPDKITSINLSTTLSTNAIVEGRTEKVGVLVSAGPGIDPEHFSIGNFHVIQGSIDHRGEIIRELDAEELTKAADQCEKDGIKVFAAVSKFSTRNPDHEDRLARSIRSQADFVTRGHRLSGQLSFPRRIATAYYNSAVWRIYNSFSDAMNKSLAGMGLTGAGINILKADGGTIPLEFSKNFPVETILSGPAASIMGIIALCHIHDDSIILDIGGTTTDIAIFASGAPLIEKDGIAFNSVPTMVRALNTYSIGIGGDSVIKVKDNAVTAGPERLGPAMANGGEEPTLVDAMNFTGVLATGDVSRSKEGISALGKKSGLSPKKIAREAMAYSVGRIKSEIERMLDEINNKPVYTIHEMLEDRSLNPKKIFAMGGPALGFKGFLADSFGMDVEVPENFQVANAIGAALARTTFSAELFADTSRGALIIPNINVQEEIGTRYTLDEAKRDAVDYLLRHMKELGASIEKEHIEIIEASSFNMVSGFYSSGKDIRVKCQIKPGVTMELKV